MAKIIKIDEGNLFEVKDFLLNVPAIETIDEEILLNGVIAKEETKIIGCLSYEIFDKNCLIRYFVFKKVLNNEEIEELFKELELSAFKKNLNQIFCIAKNEMVENLFINLGFEVVDKKNFFLDEVLFDDSLFLASSILKKRLK